MERKIMIRIAMLISALILFSQLASSPPVIAQGQPQEGMTVEASLAVADSPTAAEAVSYLSPPVLSAEQLLQVEKGMELSYLSPPVDTSTPVEIAGPMPGSESTFLGQNSPLEDLLAPGDPNIYVSTQFGNSIPDGYKSNLMSGSTDGKGPEMFYTGNWFAAKSQDKGESWTFMDPFSGFPEFCCSQIALYDETRDIYLWLRTGNVDGNGNNVFKLGVDRHDPFEGGYWIYTTAPTNVNGSWTNQFWNAPTMHLGPDYLYISMTMFNQSYSWLRSVVLRWPLDALAKGQGFSYNYFTDVDWFTFMPVDGASHTMYFASNWDITGGAPYDSLRIWRWHEDSGSLTFWTKTVPAWTATGRGSMHCGTPNWLGWGDQRLLSGALYEIHNDGIAEPRQTGRKVLGWWWNVAEGGGFTYPYIEAAAFYEDTMTLLPGYLGRPYVYGGWCFAYPSFSTNNRGDLGGVFNYSQSPDYHKPKIAMSIADDYYHAPPGWLVLDVAQSGAGPSDARWGYFNTARSYHSGTTWIAGSHYIPGTTNCTNCSVPLWISFGRERDEPNFSYSCRFFGSCIPLLLRK